VQRKATCEFCHYWGRERWLGMPEECRRHAPMLKEQDGLPRPSWPRTEHTDWCGDFEERLDSENNLR
jgi:hypothetical protein